MKRLYILLITCFLLVNAHAADRAATEASVKRLLVVTQSEKIIDAMYAQMDSILKASMNQAIAGRPLNTEQRKIIDGVPARMMTLFKEGLSWKSLEPELVDLYQKSFTEREVKDMIAFYQSPTGKAVIERMPIVMQSSMQIGHSLVEPLMPKFQQLIQETVQQLNAASSK